MRRRGGRRAGAHIVGRPTRHRARLGPVADVRRGRVRRHPFGARRLRATAAGQARAARHGHQFRTATAAAAVHGPPAQETIGQGGQTAPESADHRRPTPETGPDRRPSFPVVGLPDSSIATLKSKRGYYIILFIIYFVRSRAHRVTKFSGYLTHSHKHTRCVAYIQQKKRLFFFKKKVFCSSSITKP